MKTRQMLLSASLALGMLTAMPQFAFGQYLINKTGFVKNSSQSKGSKVGSVINQFLGGIANGINNSNQSTNTNSSSSGFLIDKTGFYDSNGNKIEKKHNGFLIDKTGVVGSATFGSLHNFNDGSCLLGLLDSNGFPEAGRMYYTNGDVYYGFFENGLRESESGLYEWKDGSWYYGGWSNNERHGEGSFYSASEGVYYEQTWSNGNLISSVQVDSPKYDRNSYHEMMINADIAKTTGSSSSTNSSSKSSTSSNKSCTSCNGTGVLPVETTISTYGLSNGKKQCSICNKWVLSGVAHSHTQCNLCGGTGILK